MRLMLAALVATSTIAIVAAVFALWPVIADAPWEDDPIPTANPLPLLRCQEALDLRQEASARLSKELDAQEEERSDELAGLAELAISLREQELGRVLTQAERRDMVLDVLGAAPAIMGRPEPVLAEQQIDKAEVEIDTYC